MRGEIEKFCNVLYHMLILMNIKDYFLSLV